MSNTVKYSAINTKVRALEGMMLNAQQYSKLMECKTYRDAMLYLKEETEYGKAFENYNKDHINRGLLEFILKRYSLERIVKLSHYFVGDYKRFFRILLMRFEIEDLKVIVRGKYLGKSNEDIREHLIYNSSLNYVDYNKVLTAKSVKEVVENLKDTPYYKHLAPVADSVTEEGLFRIEMIMDFIYFSSIRKFLSKISKDDREEVKRIIGVECDLLNIQWIFRGKKYYYVSPEVLFNYTIYDGYKLNSAKIKKLCYTKNMEEFYDLVDKFSYGEIFKKSKDEYLIEKEVMVYIKKMLEKYKRENKLNISFVLAYVKLMIIEVRNIISIIENKKYNIQTEEALKYVSITY